MWSSRGGWRIGSSRRSVKRTMSGWFGRSANASRGSRPSGNGRRYARCWTGKLIASRETPGRRWGGCCSTWTSSSRGNSERATGKPTIDANAPALFQAVRGRPRLARVDLAVERGQGGSEGSGPGQSVGAEEAALPREGEERHLPLHGGRAEPVRAV